MQRKTFLTLLLVLMAAPLFAGSQVHVYKGIWTDKFYWEKADLGNWENVKSKASFFLVVQVTDDGTVAKAMRVDYGKDGRDLFYYVSDATQEDLRFWRLSSTVCAVTMNEGDATEVGWGKVASSSTSPVASSYSGYGAAASPVEIGVESFSLRQDSKRSQAASGMGVDAYFRGVLIPYLENQGYELVTW